MRVLFLTVSAGEGHNSICRALNDFVANHYPDVETKTVDLYKNRDKLRTYLVNKGYFTLCRLAIKFSNFLFERTKRIDYRKKKITPATFFVDKSTLKYVENSINDFQPDVIFCAHTFAGISVQKLLEAKNKVCENAKTFSIVSDFDIAPSSELLNKINYIFVPNHDFDDDLIKKGFKKEQIIETGIPIDQKYKMQLNQDNLREKLGLKKMFTVLIMCGGFGFGNNLNLIKNLNKSKNNFQILVINGKNQEQFNRIAKYISKHNKSNIKNFGYVKNVDELMTVSDIIITKLGGLSVSEALCKDKPIIATRKLPFQEVDNKDYLVSKNVCVYINSDSVPYKIVDNFINNEANMEKFRLAISTLKKPNATEEICNFMIGKSKRYVRIRKTV